MEELANRYFSDQTFENLRVLPILVVMDPDLQQFLIVGPQAAAKIQQDLFTEIFAKLPSHSVADAIFIIGKVGGMVFSGMVTCSDHAEPGTKRLYWLFWGLMFAPQCPLPRASEFIVAFTSVGEIIARAFDRPLSINLSNEIDRMYIANKEGFDDHKRRLMDAFELYSGLFTLKVRLRRPNMAHVFSCWFNRIIWHLRPRFYCVARVGQFRQMINLYFSIWHKTGGAIPCVIWHEDIFARKEYSAVFVIRENNFNLHRRLFQIVGRRKKPDQKIKVSAA